MQVSRSVGGSSHSASETSATARERQAFEALQTKTRAMRRKLRSAFEDLADQNRELKAKLDTAQVRAAMDRCSAWAEGAHFAGGGSR